MAEGRSILAIDIGNTRAHFGLIDIERMECVEKRFIPSESFRELLVSTVFDIFERHDKSFCSQIVISTVIHKFAKIAHSTLDELFPKNVKIARYSEKLPFQCNYKKPEKTGSDRLANVLYAYNCHRNRNCILISAGTAVTIDILKNGCFLGGTILPGLRTQFGSLSHSTDALPAIDVNDLTEEIKVPGNSTESCITSGIVFGIAGAVERIVSESVKIAGHDSLIIAAGGDWNLISKFVAFNHLHVPDMTLIGTAMFADIL